MRKDIRRVPIHGTRIPVTHVVEGIWGKPKVALPWNGGDEQTEVYTRVTRKDKGYTYPTITMIAYKDNLFVRFRRYDGKLRYLTIQQFRSYYALEILQAYPDMGRHFSEALHTLYHTLGLHLGYVQPITCFNLIRTP